LAYGHLSKGIRGIEYTAELSWRRASVNGFSERESASEMSVRDIRHNTCGIAPVKGVLIGATGPR
jgi:hypothetical protein